MQRGGGTCCGDRQPPPHTPVPTKSHGQRGYRPQLSPKRYASPRDQYPVELPAGGGPLPHPHPPPPYRCSVRTDVGAQGLPDGRPARGEGTGHWWRMTRVALGTGGGAWPPLGRAGGGNRVCKNMSRRGCHRRRDAPRALSMTVESSPRAGICAGTPPIRRARQVTGRAAPDRRRTDRPTGRQESGAVRGEEERSNTRYTLSWSLQAETDGDGPRRDRQCSEKAYASSPRVPVERGTGEK